MRRIGIAAVLCGLLAAPADAGGVRKVKVLDDVFAPTSLKVAKNTKVKWVWRGENKHDVAVERGPVFFRSAPQRTGRFRWRFRKKGAYKLVCTIHSPEMRMTVRVR